MVTVTVPRPKTKTRAKPERPRLYKVLLLTMEVAESKATRGTDEGAKAGYPLTFTTERED